MTTIERAVVFGSGSGVGRAAAIALAAGGARVWAVARTAATVTDLGERITAVAGDATDPAVVAKVIDDADPDLVVVSVGVRPRMAALDEQTWDSFAAVWNGDVKATFHVGQQALRRPLREGSTVVIVSSGAGLGGSPLSGGYAGAKRMQMFVADYLQKIADARGLGVRFVALVPRQFIAGTAMADAGSAAYAAAAGITAAQFMATRFDAPLDATGVAGAIVQIAGGGAPAGTILSITGAKGIERI